MLRQFLWELWLVFRGAAMIIALAALLLAFPYMLIFM